MFPKTVVCGEEWHDEWGCVSVCSLYHHAKIAGMYKLLQPLGLNSVQRPYIILQTAVWWWQWLHDLPEGVFPTSANS